MPIRLGRDAFIKKEISAENIKRLVTTIQGFSHLVAAYKPVDIRACATSAMRDSSNKTIVRQCIKDRTGVDIQIIEGKEEADIIFANQPWRRLPDNGACLYVDVGGGSTEITIFSNDKTRSRSFNIGTIRLMEDLVKKSQWKQMKNWIQKHTFYFNHLNAIGSGGNINKIIKMGKHPNRKSITLSNMKKVKKCLKSFSIHDRIVKLGLKPDRADVILPALKIYISVMKWGGVEQICVPQIGLADGLVRQMYEQYAKQLPKTAVN